MPVRFLDEPQAEAPKRTVRFLDEPPPRRVRFLDAPSIEEKMSNPAYIPTMGEWKEFREGKEDSDLSAGEMWSLIKSGAKGVYNDLTNAFGAGVGMVGEGDVEGIINSALEGGARGTVDLLMLAQKGRYAALDQIPGMNSDENKYGRFVSLRKLNAIRHAATTGDSHLLEDIVGRKLFNPEAVNTELAEGVSYVADPTMVIPGAGAGAKTASKVTGKALQGGGKLASTGAEAAQAVGARISEAVPGPVKAVGLAGAAGTAGAMAGLPGIAGAAAGAAATRAALPTIKQAGDLTAAAGEAIARGPSQMGLLETVAKNPQLPSAAAQTAGALRPLDPVLSAAGNVARGAAVGSGMGFGLGAITDGKEGALQGLGSGLALGGVGAGAGQAISTATGRASRFRTANDVARVRQQQIDGGLAPEVWDGLPLTTKEAASHVANLVEGKAGLRMMGAADYQKVVPDGGAVAYFDPAKQEIVINAQAPNIKGNMIHELGHAIFQSPAVDKSQILSELTRVYGPEGIEAMGLSYSRKLLEARVADNLVNQNKAVTPEQIHAAKDAIDPKAVERTYKTFLKNDPTYFVQEVFSEHLMAEGIGKNLNNLRKRGLTGRAASSLARPLIEAKGAILRNLGVDIGPTGKLESRLLGDLSADKKLSASVKQWLRDFDGHIGPNARVKKPVADVSVSQVFEAGKGTFAKRADGVLENDLFRIEGDPRAPSAIKPKTKREYNRTVKARAKEIAEVIPEGVVDSSEPTVARKLSGDKEEIRGTKLPEEILNLPSMEYLRETASVVESAMASGGSLDSWVAVIGTGPAWKNSVKRKKGDIPAQRYSYLPYEYHITKNGHVNVRAIDWDHVRAKIDSWAAKGQLRLWGNDRAAFRDDVYRYFRNHQQGLAGAAGLTKDKANAINAFYNLDNSASNDLSKAWNRGDERIYKSLRLERILNTRQGPDNGHFFDFEKVKGNLRPKLEEKRLNNRGGAIIRTEKGRAVRIHSKARWRVFDANGRATGFARTREEAVERL